MDKLEIKLKNRYYSKYPSEEIVEIYINDKNLIDILHDYERRYDEKLAGSYGNVTLEEFKSEYIEQTYYKVLLLGCKCGIWGCWPFLTNVSKTNNSYIWTDFEQPFREEWDYKELGNFEFEKENYEKEMNKLSIKP